MEEFQILIIDDDPEQLKILTGHFLDHSPQYKLLIATNGKSGYDIALKNRPDLILMDWEMPVLNGIDTIRLLKNTNETSSIPVIMVTGKHNEIESLKEALEAGAIDFINKPFNSVELNARVNSHLNHLKISRKYLAQQEYLIQKEKEIIEKEKTILESELKHHQRQLTMNTVNILKQSVLLKSVVEDVESLLPYTSDEGKKIIKNLVSKLNDRSSERMWDEFQVTFEKVHPDFYQKLVERIPDISVRERRLCSFLKLNMSTKEIAAITFQTNNAIDVAKHRLRKKVGINSDEDFSNYLITL
ncbi:MAG TPA: response regulator [Bacteroidales bacterium]|nr:response regulator [Bacteroidales bacterium]